MEIRCIFQAYSSDLNRAYETCCIILSHNATSAKDLEVEKLTSLRERGFGPWEGKLVSEYHAEAKKAAIPGFDVSDISLTHELYVSSLSFKILIQKSLQTLDDGLLDYF